MKAGSRVFNKRALKIAALFVVSALLVWPISAINSEGVTFPGLGAGLWVGNGNGSGSGTGQAGGSAESGNIGRVAASTQRDVLRDGIFAGGILSGSLYRPGTGNGPYLASGSTGSGASSGSSVDVGAGTGSTGGSVAGGNQGAAGSGKEEPSGTGSGSDIDNGGITEGQEDVAPGIIRVASYDDLKRLIGESISRNYSGYYDGMPVASKGIILESSQAVNGAGAARDGSSDAVVSVQAPSGGSGDYSATNVQVEGVDEADIVKTDGEYIYQVNNNRIVIVKAYPAGSMEVMSVTDFRNEKFSVSEIYIDNGLFIAIGSAQLSVQPVTQKTDSAGLAVKPGVAEPAIAPDIAYTDGRYFPTDSTQVLIYDLKDIRKPALVRTTAIDGYYVSSRKIGDVLYVVTNKNTYLYYNDKDPGLVVPQYRDTGAAGGGVVQLAFDNIYYFPGTEMSGYLIVGAIPLKDTKAAARVNAYLGAGSNVYASTQNLYVAVSHYRTITAQPQESISVKYDINTLVYKFGLEGTDVIFKGKGEVPGTILNQFSMDEYLEYFRIATTKGNVWATGDNISKNNIYVLDSGMKQVGKIEDIAPGEKIYSTRFMGIRVYMVTFRTVDPLFVIDLSDPAAPKILGALKIPGYSDYLHPYDENHIIGFGKDTAEVSSSKVGGGGDDTMSFYQGIKMALFDVTDVTNPIQKFSVIIGDRGTTSELLSNHKALMFSKEKGLLAFPVTLYERDATGTSSGGTVSNDLYRATQYGQFTFQGAYVYSIDLVNGFILKGRITHMTAEDYLKAGSYFYNGSRMVRRILYISEMLYTLSDTLLRANRIDTLEQAGQAVIP